jgi:hypothetical protein
MSEAKLSPNITDDERKVSKSNSRIRWRSTVVYNLPENIMIRNMKNPAWYVLKHGTWNKYSTLSCENRLKIEDDENKNDEVHKMKVHTHIEYNENRSPLQIIL